MAAFPSTFHLSRTLQVFLHIVFLYVIAICGQAELIQNLHYKNCKVENIKTHQNFNISLYAGKWHVIYDYNVEGKVFFQMANPEDMMADFIVQNDGNLKLKTGANIHFFGSNWLTYCFTGTGVGTFEDKSAPAKMTMRYETALPYSPASWAKPYWILGTDYNYALIYSCWKTRDDGTCHPDYTFAWTLSRKRHGHSPKQQYFIDKTARLACLDPSRFKRRKSHKVCQGV